MPIMLLCGKGVQRAQAVARIPSNRAWPVNRLQIRYLLHWSIQEMHSYPILTEEWGADECVFVLPIQSGTNHKSRELLLVEGLSIQGMGNWEAVAEHIGTRTKEEVEKHYNEVYVNSKSWPLPVRLLNPVALFGSLILTFVTADGPPVRY